MGDLKKNRLELAGNRARRASPLLVVGCRGILCLMSLSPQAKSCICHMCGAHLNRLHSCLYCVFFGCFTRKHIHEHAKNKRHNLGESSAAASLQLRRLSLLTSACAFMYTPVAHCSISHQDYSSGRLPSLRRGAYCPHGNALSSQMSGV